MYTNVNLAAPVGVLAFLGSGLLILAAALTLVGSLIARRFRFAKLVLIALLVITGIYLGAMLAFSLAGGEKVLARDQGDGTVKIVRFAAIQVASSGDGFTVKSVKVILPNADFDLTARKGDRSNNPNPSVFGIRLVK